MGRNSEDLPTLVAQAGPLNGQRWVLNDSLLIGRDESCHVVIPSKQVSRNHARLTLSDSLVTLEDLVSKNGTHCNGKPIYEPVYLSDGDIIQVALAQQFLFVSSDATLPLDSSGMEMLEAAGAERRLKIDSRSHRVWVLEREVLPPLSAAQFQLLELLCKNPGRIIPRNELITTVWEEDAAIGVSEQALDALIRRLRDRLAAFDPTHSYIVTVRGHGIRLDNPLR